LIFEKQERTKTKREMPRAQEMYEPCPRNIEDENFKLVYA
jgi:hypothetical protein